jgi:hypothetical protein
MMIDFPVIPASTCAVSSMFHRSQTLHWHLLRCLYKLHVHITDGGEKLLTIRVLPIPTVLHYGLEGGEEDVVNQQPLAVQ